MEFEWIEIPSGPFIMGTQEEDVNLFTQTYHLTCFSWEAPEKKVYVDTFEISKYPVTNAQYREFVEATGYSAVSPYLAQYVLNNDQSLADHPVAWISWYDALAFCQWAGCRLPTEAEWEKAARGPEGFTYPWGNDWRDNHCNSLEATIGMTTSVGSYPQGASPYGVCDMAGNVWEWTNGWVITNTIMPKFPATESDTEEQLNYFHQFPILRGGSIGANKIGVRCAFRFIKYEAHDWGDWVGFRCVKLQRRPRKLGVE